SPFEGSLRPQGDSEPRRRGARLGEQAAGSVGAQQTPPFRELRCPTWTNSGERIRAAKSMSPRAAPGSSRQDVERLVRKQEIRGRLGGLESEKPQGRKGMGRAIARDRPRPVHVHYLRRGLDGPRR